MRALPGRMIERLLKLYSLSGLTLMQSTLGMTSGAPVLSRYAVEPVGRAHDHAVPPGIAHGLPVHLDGDLDHVGGALDDHLVHAAVGGAPVRDLERQALLDEVVVPQQAHEHAVELAAVARGEEPRWPKFTASTGTPGQVESARSTVPSPPRAMIRSSGPIALGRQAGDIDARSREEALDDVESVIVIARVVAREDSDVFQLEQAGHGAQTIRVRRGIGH
jgi:hypothetical protein